MKFEMKSRFLLYRIDIIILLVNFVYLTIRQHLNSQYRAPTYNHNKNTSKINQQRTKLSSEALYYLFCFSYNKSRQIRYPRLTIVIFSPIPRTRLLSQRLGLRSDSVSLWVAHQFNVNNLEASAEHNKTWQDDRLLYFHSHFPFG